MARIEVKFGDWIQQGFDLYKNNIATLIVAALIALVLSAATLGILAGPMMAGLMLMTLRFLDQKEPKPEIGDVFKGFEVFLQSFLLYLSWGIAYFIISFVLNVLPCIGQLLAPIIGLALNAFIMLTLFVVAERKVDFIAATKQCFELVKTNIWPFIGLGILISIIGAIGAVVCGIGAIVTLPISLCIMAVVYRDIFRQPTPGTTVITPEPPPATEQPRNDG